VSGSVPFDRAVEYYDRTRGLSEEASREMTALLVGELQGRGPCLEIGVGTGLVALPLATAGLPMVGVDLSAPMLGRLVEKAGGHAPFPLVRADATMLPFADDSFGGAVLRHVLHLVPGWERVIGEMIRVVSPGGTILVSRGDIPAEVREVTARFLELTGTASMASGLDPRDETSLDEAFERRGTRRRDLPPISERAEQSVGEFVAQMGEGLHSWTWGIDEEARREAAAEVRRWALERFGTLDPPEARDVAIEWRAYDLA
jgi:SAM-dependent methyltransferase